MNNKQQRYRAASWWITWEDLSYPDLGIEKKIKQKAAAFNDAGIDLAMVFGIHFRWDFIYMWDRAHDLLKLMADELHKYDIKLFDHHSANLTCRPKDFATRWENFYRNKHHIPFYPAKHIVDELSFNGSKLNDFRMLDVVTGEPCYLPQYSAEVYCMNNPEYQAAYGEYLKMLFNDTGIDGLMCDDIIYYPGWHGCGCKYCKAKFKQKSGIELPAADDSSFWGNYDSPAFCDWVEMHYNDAPDFLANVKTILKPGTPLLTCCSDSWPKHIDQYGVSICTLQNSINHGMLEMCSEILSEDNSYTERMPNIMLHNGILAKKHYPSLGLGYGFSPDTAFLTWALNILTGSSCWMSTLKGRLGLGKEDADQLPDEENIVQEGYLFEKNNPQLFTGQCHTTIALYFSFNSLKFSGDSTADYSDTYKSVVNELFSHNLQFEVIDSLDYLAEYSVLLMHDASCLSASELSLVDKFIANGGTVVATGLTAVYNEQGEKSLTPWLNSYGITATMAEVKRERLTADKFFTPFAWPLKRQAKQFANIEHQGQTVNHRSWIEVERGSGKLYWSSLCCQDSASVKALSEKLNTMLPAPDFKLKIDGEWFWRIYRDGNRYLIYGLSNEITATEDPVLYNHMTQRKIVRSLEYLTCSDKIEVISRHKIAKATIYSPDYQVAIPGMIEANTITFDNLKLVRFFIVELSLAL